VQSVPIYVLDEWGDHNGRKWESMIPAFKQLSLVEAQSGKFALSEALQDSSIIIIHRRVLEDKCRLSVIEEWITDVPASVAIVISGGAQREGLVAPGRVYFRYASVGTVDLEFKRIFQDFIDRFQSGRVEFSSLDPPNLPEAIVALYLIAIASEFSSPDQDRVWNDEFVQGLLNPQSWNVAREEFNHRLDLDRRGKGNPIDDSISAAAGVASSTDVAGSAKAWPHAIFENGRPKPGVLEALKSALGGGRVAL
jgi:hypothetical protein